MAYAIYGRTGIGKTTTLFKTLLSRKKNVLFVRSLEDLSEFTNQTDILFDDISFQLSRPEVLLHLCDNNFHTSVRILRNCVRIPGTVRKWFTHNEKSAWEPILATDEQQQAINRRLIVQHVRDRKSIEKHILSILDVIDDVDSD